MKQFISLSAICLCTLFFASCSKDNKEPITPGNKTAEIRYEATVDDPENFNLNIHYSIGEYNTTELPDGYEGKQVTTESPFKSEIITVNTGALLWLSATIEPKNEDYITTPMSANVEVKLYINGKLEHSKQSYNYAMIYCLYNPDKIIKW